MIDVGVYYLNYDIDSFYNLFLQNPLSKRFEKGDPFIIWGKSGTEIAFEITDKNINDFKDKQAVNDAGLKLHRSPEYWAGWSLAYYQWYSGKTFKEIDNSVSIKNIVHLYNPYHEMDILQFCDKLNALLNDKKREPERSL